MNLNDALKYGSGDEQAMKDIINGMHLYDWLAADHPFNPKGEDQDRTKRGVLADAYEGHTGDTEGADLLRDPTQTVVYHKGKMKRGVLRHRDAAGDFGGERVDPDTGEYYPIWKNIEEGNIEDAHTEAAMNYDMGEGQLSEEPPYGSGDHKDHLLASPPYTTFTHNPRLGYWSLTEHHLLPEEQADRTYMHSRG